MDCMLASIDGRFGVDDDGGVLAKNATLIYVLSLLKQQPSFMISPPTYLFLNVLFTVFFFFDLFN